ncbi:glycoside hydrolase family 16 protein [Hyaloscypha hepaticicola]|uniref:chitinase n=1 Tax=Hyaloscypha hepaticicola TaxID=2082293 RepID=A0A2J6Q997_9HELO|nr:glycoside hydrolase family 16 protein [Hyaloscypha hepaticicola]
MLSTPLAATAVLLSALSLVNGQTFTDCNPTTKSYPGYGKGNTVFTDFTKGASTDWDEEAGTTISYSTSGAEFNIKVATDAPTIQSSKYIMFGQVDVFLKASPGQGIVSSFILESDDLDEIDWEWLGSTDTSVESNFFGKGNTTTYDRAIYHNVASPIETWHNYSITWTAESTKWYIDGALQRTLLFGDALALGGKNYPQTPMRVKMGNWVGCASAAANQPSSPTYGTCQWAGGPATFGATTWTMLVANVTINDFGCGGEYTYSDMTGDWQSIKSSGTCDGGSSSSGSATSAGSSTQTTSGAILAQTSASNGTSKTTMSTATGTGSSTKSTGSGSSTTSGGPLQATSNDGNGSKKSKYGVIDVAVIALGLGLGYLVM